MQRHRRPRLLSQIFSSSAAGNVSANRAVAASSNPVAALRRLLLLRRASIGAALAHAAVAALKSISETDPDSPPAVLHHLHARLLKTNLLADAHIACALLGAYALSCPGDARRVFDEIPFRNVVAGNVMLACISRTGELSATRSFFQGMEEKDLATWTTMVGAYTQGGQCASGFELFREMMDAGDLRPDQQMLVTLLTGCRSKSSHSLQGKSVHAYAERNGLEFNTLLGASLIDMYAKSGRFKDAFRVFERIPQRDVMPWTAMICGLAVHGHGEEAVAFFKEMRKAGIKPNQITFTGVLKACCHAGLIEEGKRYYESMVDEFGYEPAIQHYGCMVELFAKAGRLEEAYEVIENMTIEPNFLIWSCFLSACKKYKNFQIAEKGLKKVLSAEIPGEYSWLYAVISDLYLLGSKWNDAERIRRLTDESSIKENKASS